MKFIKYITLLSHLLLSHSQGDVMPIGSSQDDNGCLIGAGYSWCEETNSCIRRWITPCSDNYNDCHDCLKRQRKGENIACPTECDNITPTCQSDDDCGDLYFCRPTNMNSDGPKECVLYSKEGDTCGGYTLPSYESRCNLSLECVNTMGPYIADAPGICMTPCDTGSYRDEYGECNNIKDHIMLPEPLLGGFHCQGCPPSPPCPLPGPNCEYTSPIEDECGCTTECGTINCHPIDPVIPPPRICSEVMCMMYCEFGNQIDENGCNICACNPGPVTDNTCSIPYENCESEYVCPKITEITQCGEGGIQGMTTYQLSLVIKNENIKNIYALFGETAQEGHQMIFPEAYQVQGSFRSNIGGISEDIFSISPNARYDSWLTIGMTDGDIDNQLASIGIDFNKWDLNQPLVIENGAVFVLNSDYDRNELTEIIIAQLTLPNHVSAEASVNVQGKMKHSYDTWNENNIIFTLNTPEKENNNIPLNCNTWFDGCNTCRVNNGVLGACTRMMCFREDTPICLSFETGH